MEQYDELREELEILKLETRQRQAFGLIFAREIRTLVQRMLALLSVVRQRPHVQSLNAIQSCLEHLQAITEPLQDTLGPGWSNKLQPIEFSVQQTLAEVSRWLDSEARAKVTEIHCIVADNVPTRLYGDVVKLRQILLQLLDNAVKHSSGDVIVDVSGTMELCFCVRDTGPGLSIEQIETLLADTSLQAEPMARDLGIRLVHHLVQILGGKLWIESEPDKGTSFFFSLPFAVPCAQVGETVADTEKKVRRVLLAEDDAICQRVALRILNSQGHKVDIVANGLDALAALQRSSYDVVLLDIEMPELDGLETARQINQRFSPAPYLIALTSGNSAADRRKVMLSGMQDFLSKPLRAAELDDAFTQIPSPPGD